MVVFPKENEPKAIEEKDEEEEEEEDNDDDLFNLFDNPPPSKASDAKPLSAIKTTSGEVIRYIACGSDYSVAINTAGVLYIWGRKDVPSTEKTIEEVRLNVVSDVRINTRKNKNKDNANSNAKQYHVSSEYNPSDEDICLYFPTRAIGLEGQNIIQVSCGIYPTVTNHLYSI